MSRRGGGSPRSPKQEPPDVPPVAGERTWFVFLCATNDHPMHVGFVAEEFEACPACDGPLKVFEVVELSRLRAAEEERDRLKRNEPSATCEGCARRWPLSTWRKGVRCVLCPDDACKGVLATDTVLLSRAVAELARLREGGEG